MYEQDYGKISAYTRASLGLSRYYQDGGLVNLAQNIPGLFNKGGKVNGRGQRNNSGGVRGLFHLEERYTRGLQNGGRVSGKVFEHTGFNREELIERLTAKDPLTHKERFPGLPQLLVDPYIEIAKDYHAPFGIFDRLKTDDDYARPDMPMGIQTPARMLRIQYPTNPNRDHNLLQFHSAYRNFPNWQEFLADKGIHEAGHLLSFSKTYDFNAPQQMPR